MVQDYFSLYSKDKTFLLLRIHHKVDFSDEIAWSHCWDLAKEDCFDEITEKIFTYLTQGFDCIEHWQGDQAGWHESIKHLGFEPVVVEMELLPAFIRNSSNPYTMNLKSRFQTNQYLVSALQIPTYVGALYEVLSTRGIQCKKPRVPSAVCYIKVDSVLSENWAEIVKNLDQYSLD